MAGNGFWVGITRGNQHWVMQAAGSTSTTWRSATAPLYNDFESKPNAPVTPVVVADVESANKKQKKVKKARKEWTEAEKQKDKKKQQRKKLNRRIRKEVDAKLATKVAPKQYDQKDPRMPYFGKKSDTLAFAKVERKFKLTKKETTDEEKTDKKVIEQNYIEEKIRKKKEKSRRKRLNKQIRKEKEIQGNSAAEAASVLQQVQKFPSLPPEFLRQVTENDDGTCIYCSEVKEECTCLKIDCDYKREEDSSSFYLP